jgi:hypothetical protein
MRLLFNGWNIQVSTSAPNGSLKILRHWPLATFHNRAVPSNEEDSITSLESDQQKSEKILVL